jgi:predicted GIY-YIG superfamily endonuclease
MEALDYSNAERSEESPKKEVLRTIYILKCKEGKYYVGKTSNMETRYELHAAGTACAWTKKYPPIGIIKTYPNLPVSEQRSVPSAAEEEERYTKLMMRDYGIENVRGGAYTMIDLEPSTIEHLKREIWSMDDRCYNCGGNDHYVNKCPKKNYKCFSCGLEGHFSRECPNKNRANSKATQLAKYLFEDEVDVKTPSVERSEESQKRNDSKELAAERFPMLANNFLQKRENPQRPKIPEGILIDLDDIQDNYVNNKSTAKVDDILNDFVFTSPNPVIPCQTIMPTQQRRINPPPLWDIAFSSIAQTVANWWSSPSPKPQITTPMQNNPIPNVGKPLPKLFPIAEPKIINKSGENAEQTYNSSMKPNKLFCVRCGRNNHNVSKCYARTHLNGNPLDKR